MEKSIQSGSATCEATVKALDDYFVPKANVPSERNFFDKLYRKVKKPLISSFVGFANEQSTVSSVKTRTTVSVIKFLTVNNLISDIVVLVFTPPPPGKCYSSKLRRKFLEKEGALTLDDLLRIARSQEAVDRQLKQYGTD